MRHAIWVFLALVLSLRAGAQTDPVLTGFRNVPPEARMRMFWRVFGPAWSRDEIDRELREMKAAGLGGLMTAITYPAAVDEPSAGIVNQRYLSPEFLDSLRYAAKTAHDLGLEFNAYGGTGWPFGGPSVSLADSAHRIRMERPARLPDGSGWRLPRLREGERYFAAFLRPNNPDRPPNQSATSTVSTAQPPDAQAIDVTSAIRGDRLEIAAGSRAAQAGPEPSASVFIVGPTFMKVKRPALGGEGYVIDHYSRQATLHYLESAVAPLLASSPPGAGIRTIFCDSLEVYGANWTDALPAEFERRRGYALTPHLPDLFDRGSPAGPGVRFDFWRTLAELAEENFAHTVNTWLHGHGVRFALQAYGTPPLGLTAATECDIPWGEQYEYRGFSFSRFAASGAHLAGKRIIGAEAWTWAGIPNRVGDTLADLTLLSDFHFLAGENELTGVDFAYSPPAAGSPGWMPYFGPVMNRNNPQWAVFPDLVAYANRCQWILRQGRPVADVALYLPEEDCFADGQVEQMALDFKVRDRLATLRTDEFGLQKALKHNSDIVGGIQRAGLNFDGIDLFAMNRLATMKGSERAPKSSRSRSAQENAAGSARIIAGDGEYRVIVLPALKSIELQALQKIAAFCRAGGAVIATDRLPDTPAGRAAPEAMAALRTLIVELFGGSSADTQTWLEMAEPPGGGSVPRSVVPRTAHRHACGHGFALFTDGRSLDLAAALRSVLPADIERTDSPPDIGFAAPYHVHRAAADRDFYFVSRLPGDRDVLRGAVRGTGRLSFWDPMDGSVHSVQSRTLAGQTEFTLAPFRSGFLCLERGKSAAVRTAPLSADAARLDEKPVQGEWNLSFEGPDAPAAVTIRNLNSWTALPGGRSFSGCGIYRTTLNADAGMRRSCRLRLEAVRDAAVVFVNGRRAGSIWEPPYALDIAPLLQIGPNRLEIRVYNTLANRVLGLPDPDLRALRAAYGNRFPDPQEKRIMREPTPAGITGTVWVGTQR